MGCYRVEKTIDQILKTLFYKNGYTVYSWCYLYLILNIYKTSDSVSNHTTLALTFVIMTHRNTFERS